MKTGIVKFFDSREGKLFGFIRKDDGNEVFFHVNDYHDLLISHTDGEIVFTKNSPLLEFPKQGDEIAFEEKSDFKGPKASKWTTGKVYKEAQEISENINRKLSKKYRVMSQYGFFGRDAETQDPKIIFEGSLKDLNKAYPKPKEKGHRLDELWPYHSNSDFDQRIWIEHQEGDNWVSCKDPRIPLNEKEFRRAKHDSIYHNSRFRLNR